MEKRLILMLVAVLLCLGMTVGLTSCMKKDDYHTKSDVNSLISELKTEMETKIAGNETAIANLKTEYNEKILSLKTENLANQESIFNLSTAYTNKVAELSAQDKLTADALAALTAKYETDLAALNKADANNTAAIEALEEEYTDKVAELTAQDKLIAETLAALTTEYAKSLAILNKADADNKAAVEALDEKYAKEVADLKAIIADVQASIVAATNEYAAAVATLNGKIEENNKKIDAETVALEASINSLTEKHDSEIAEINNLIAELEKADADNAKKIAEFEAKVDLLVTKYTVSFDLNGGSGNIPTQQVMRGDKVAKPEPPTREGYDFLGWYVEDEQWSFAGHVVTEDMILTAKYVCSRTEEVLTNEDVSFMCDASVSDNLYLNELSGSTFMSFYGGGYGSGPVVLYKVEDARYGTYLKAIAKLSEEGTGTYFGSYPLSAPTVGDGDDPRVFLEATGYYVHDFDISTESKFLKMDFVSIARQHTTNSGVFFSENINLSEYVVAGEWTHVTIIGDLAKNVVYLFVDGTLVGQVGRANIHYPEPINMYGFRFSTTQSITEGETLLVGNMCLRTYDSNSEIESAIDSGTLKSWSENISCDTN